MWFFSKSGYRAARKCRFTKSAPLAIASSC